MTNLQRECDALSTQRLLRELSRIFWKRGQVLKDWQDDKMAKHNFIVLQRISAQLYSAADHIKGV